MSLPDRAPDVEVLESRSLFAGRIFRVTEQRLRLPDGSDVQREFVEHPGAAAVLPFLDAQTVLLVRQYRAAVGAYLLEVPAGVLDAGEEPAACAQRELREETGYSARHLHHVATLFPTPGFVQERLSLYAAWDLVPGTASPDADEPLEAVRVPVAELRERVQRGEIRDGKTVTLVAHLAAFPPPALEAWRQQA